MTRGWLGSWCHHLLKFSPLTLCLSTPSPSNQCQCRASREGAQVHPLSLCLWPWSRTSSLPARTITVARPRSLGHLHSLRLIADRVIFLKPALGLATSNPKITAVASNTCATLSHFQSAFPHFAHVTFAAIWRRRENRYFHP